MERCLLKSSDKLIFTYFREVGFEATKCLRGFIVFKPTPEDSFRAKGSNRVNWTLKIARMGHLRTSHLGIEKR
jgi:hypothetical protein